MRALAGIGAAIMLGMPLAAQSSANIDHTFKVTIGMLLPDNTVRVLPNWQFELIYLPDSTQRILLQTRLTGSTSETIPPGKYVLRSLKSFSLGDSTYRWSVPVTIETHDDSLELSNGNATVSYTPRPVVYTEAQAFNLVKRGVMRVESGLNHGSGFLLALPGDLQGVVLTNDHILAADSTVPTSVYLDSITRVPATIVARNPEADLAVLRIPSGRCADCPRLALAAVPEGGQAVTIGSRVLALGFPLAREQSLPAIGDVSGIRDGLIISSASITADNTGGPMINVTPAVVGVNTFRTGAVGAVSATRVAAALAGFAPTLAASTPPADRTLLTAPLLLYPGRLSTSMVDSLDIESHRRMLAIDIDHFNVSLTTPAGYRLAQKLADTDPSGAMWARVTKDWEQYVGDGQPPVVGVTVSPRANGADVWSARFYRNGVEVEPIRGAAEVRPRENGHWAYYVLPPDAFAPDSSGAPARVKVIVRDRAHPDDVSERDLEGLTAAAVWNDFRMLYNTSATRPFVPANPALRSPDIKMRCAKDGTCRIEP